MLQKLRVLCTRDNMHLFYSYSPIKPGLIGLKAPSPLLPVVNRQICVVDDGTTKDIVF